MKLSLCFGFKVFPHLPALLLTSVFESLDIVCSKSFQYVNKATQLGSYFIKSLIEIILDWTAVGTMAVG